MTFHQSSSSLASRQHRRAGIHCNLSNSSRVASSPPHFLLTLAAVVLVGIHTISLPAGCHAWSYNASSYFGASRWDQYFPLCKATKQTQSPIAFTAAERTATTPNTFSYTFSRLIDETVARIAFQTGTNAGGMVLSYPTAPFPMTVVRRGFGGIFLNQSTMFLHSIGYHAAAEHTGMLEDTPSGEVQYVFGDTVDGPSSFVFAQPLYRRSAAESAVQDTSVAMYLLQFIQAYALTTIAGSNTVNFVTPDVPYLFINTTTGFSTRSLAYDGTVSWPPCYSAKVLVAMSKAYISSAMLAAISTIGGSGAARPTQSRTSANAGGILPEYGTLQQTNPQTTTGHILFTPAPTRYVDSTVTHVRPNPKNEYMMDAIIGLVALNASLIFAIVILLLARWEWIEWPMWLGGLRRPVEWWTNPPSANVAEDGEASGDDYDEEDDEEGDDGEEEGEHAEEDDQAPRAEAV